MAPFAGSKGTMEYVILGNSAAGISAASEIRRHDLSGRVTIVSDEKTYGYSRVMLPLYMAGKVRARDMVIAPREFYSERKIRLLRGLRAEAVDAGKRQVLLENGKSIPFGRLLVATGSSPKTLSVRGSALPNICCPRKMADAEAIRKALRSTRGPVMVVGGGLVGVKSLEALVRKKRQVHLVISSNRILSQMLDQKASDLFLDAFQKAGVQVHLHTDVVAFEGRDRLEGAVLSTGDSLSCDLAVIGKGVEPNVHVVKGAGLSLRQGIPVNPQMATSVPGIFAAGDVCEPYDVLRKRNTASPLWPSAVGGGRVAGSNMAAVPATFGGALRMNSIELLGVRAVTAGDWEGKEEMTAIRDGGTVYRKLVFSGERLVGFVLVGDIGCAGVLTSLIKNQTPVSGSSLEGGLGRGFSYEPRLRALSGAVRNMVP